MKHATTDDDLTRWIAALVAASGTADEQASLLVIGIPAGSLDRIDSGEIVVVDSENAAALPGDCGRFDLAVVKASSFTDSTAATRVIAGLRDRYARRVVMIDDDELLTLSDYLALGFERLDTDASIRSFIHDPDSASRQRDWNNARNWANPENFDKYRW